MEYPVEYMMVITIAASAFITIAGIMLAIAPKERQNRFWLTSLICSLVLGAGSVVMCLNWFSSPSDGIKLLATVFIGFQYITALFPVSFIGWSITK